MCGGIQMDWNEAIRKLYPGHVQPETKRQAVDMYHGFKIVKVIPNDPYARHWYEVEGPGFEKSTYQTIRDARDDITAVIV
jgi:hypothetical protein